LAQGALRYLANPPEEDEDTDNGDQMEAQEAASDEDASVTADQEERPAAEGVPEPVSSSAGV